VGVDTWGVDFGLLARGDVLLGNPVHYRDRRTDGMMEAAASIADRDEIFRHTGLQFMQFNTLYQLLAMQRANSPLLAAAESFLMMPDLFHWLLSGQKSNEFTNATTTQFFNPRTNEWAAPLLEKLGLPTRILGKIVEPGTDLGRLRPEVAAETGLSNIRVVVPGTHDTASAVVAVPASSEPAAKPNWGYISLGTWALMGVESPQPVINDACLRLNFTNEGGVGGTIRLLKNISGLWLVQECRRIWKLGGRDFSWEELLALAESAPRLRSLINPDHPSLLAPQNMPQAIRTLCLAQGEQPPESEGQVIRCALESLALKCRQVLVWLEQLVGARLETIHIGGGGVQNRTLCQYIANACGRPVLAGPVEATAIGNVAVQAVAGGAIGSLREARQVIRASFDMASYEPRDRAAWDAAFERFVKLPN
jgi:rhamnulokinase